MWRTTDGKAGRSAGNIPRLVSYEEPELRLGPWILLRAVSLMTSKIIPPALQSYSDPVVG